MGKLAEEDKVKIADAPKGSKADKVYSVAQTFFLAVLCSIHGPSKQLPDA
jgi:hypothetical protein